MIQQPTVVSASARIRPGDEADRLALAAYDALRVDLAGLDADDWERPTECQPWTVAEMVAHLVGAAKGHASVRELVRQAVYGRRHRKEFGGSDLDAMNQLQVSDHAALTPDQLVAELQQIAPAAVAGRARMARRLGRLPVPMSEGGSSYSGMPARISLRELTTVVLTRDVWMHRFDVARATDRTPELTPALDGRLVADLAVEWCLRHGAPVELTLTGVAGGTFVAGMDGAPLTMDAVDFARVLAGRRPDGSVPESPLLATKAVF